jgi:peptide/nickel transport system substrate-binding protein
VTKTRTAGWMKEVIESVEADGNKVILNLNKPYGNLLTEFMTYSVVPEHIWANVEDPLKYEETTGSSALVLLPWSPGTLQPGSLSSVANENHFQGKPNVDRLEVHVFGNMDALVMALMKGDIDTWWDYSGRVSLHSCTSLANVRRY